MNEFILFVIPIFLYGMIKKPVKLIFEEDIPRFIYYHVTQKKGVIYNFQVRQLGLTF